MENTKELCEVQINQEGTAPKKERIRRYDVLIRVIGLLLARGTAFYVLAPFGVSYMAMERRFSKKALISCLMVCAGYLSLFDINISGKYIFATIAYMAFLFVADRGDCDIPDPLYGLYLRHEHECLSLDGLQLHRPEELSRCPFCLR